MNLIPILVMTMLLLGCSIAPTGKTASDEERKAAIQNLKSSKEDLRTIYFYRDDKHYGGYNIAIFINKKYVGSIQGNQFTKVELPLGKYLIEGSFNAETATETTRYIEGDERVRKIIRKFQTREFLISENTKGPILMRLESEFVEPPGASDLGQFIQIFRYPVEYGEEVVKKYITNAKFTIPNKDLNMDSWISKKDREEWELYSNTNSVSSLNNFIRDNPHNYFVSKARKRRDELMKVQDSEYAKAKKGNTLDSYTKFLSDHPGSPLSADAFKRMARLIKSRPVYEEYADIFPGIIDYYPTGVRYDMSLMELGPRNMKVRDILNLKKEGLGVRTIGAKIEATNAPYKDFSVKEIKHLKKRGMDEALIEAMIKSNTEYHRQMKAAKQNKEMMEQIAKLIAETKNSTTVKATTEEEKNYPVECLKLKAALKACEATGGFLAMACETTARASFECNIKL